MIQTLVARAADRTGLTPEQANTALSAALFLLEKHADPSQVKDLFASVPGGAYQIRMLWLDSSNKSNR